MEGPRPPDSDQWLELAALVNELGDSVVWSRDVGDVLAEVLTRGDRSMSNLEVTVVTVLRSRVNESCDGWRVIPPLPWLPLGFEHLSDEQWLDLEWFSREVHSAAIQGRLGDVLWEERRGLSPVESAAMALSAHQDLVADEQIDHLSRASSLRRGLYLARIRKDMGALEALVESGTQLVTAMIDSPDVSCRPTIHLIARMVETRIWREPQETMLKILLDRVTDPWALRRLAQSLIKLGWTQADAADPAIQAFRDLADRQELAIQRWTYLMQAWQLANDAGHPDRERLRTELQQANPMVNAVAHRVEVAFPRDMITRLTMEVVDSDTLAAAFRRMAKIPVFPDRDEREAERQRLSAQPTLEMFFTRFRSGEFGSVIEEAKTDKEKLDWTVRYHFAFRMKVAALQFVAGSLYQAVTAYGPHGLHSALSEVGLEDDLCRVATVEAIESFVDERWHAAASCLAPAIERAVRKVAVDHQLVVTRPPAGKTKGGVKQLGELLGQLNELDKCTLDESTLWVLNVVLASAAGGFNLRNDIAHATMERPADSSDVALMFYCLLRLLVEHGRI